MTHICVGNLTIIGSDNCLSPGRRQAIIWTNVGILLIGPLGTNFSEMLIEIQTFSFKKIHLKMSSGKRRPFCLGLNVLNYQPETVLMVLKHMHTDMSSYGALWIIFKIPEHVSSQISQRTSCINSRNLGNVCAWDVSNDQGGWVLWWWFSIPGHSKRAHLLPWCRICDVIDNHVFDLSNHSRMVIKLGQYLANDISWSHAVDPSGNNDDMAICQHQTCIVVIDCWH